MGSYLGTTSLANTNKSKAGWKRIRYTDKNGKTAYANPYQAGNIDVKKDTKIYFEMYEGYLYSNAYVSDLHSYIKITAQNSGINLCAMAPPPINTPSSIEATGDGKNADLLSCALTANKNFTLYTDFENVNNDSYCVMTYWSMIIQ